MKIECEKLSEREATPELIRELVRDGTRRVSAREVEATFLDEYDGRVSWRDRYTWELVDGNHHQVEHAPLLWSCAGNCN